MGVSEDEINDRIICKTTRVIERRMNLDDCDLAVHERVPQLIIDTEWTLRDVEYNLCSLGDKIEGIKKHLAYEEKKYEHFKGLLRELKEEK